MLSFLKRLLGIKTSSNDNEVVGDEVLSRMIEDLITDKYGDVEIDSEQGSLGETFLYVAEWVDSDGVEHKLTLETGEDGKYELRVVSDGVVQLSDEFAKGEVMSSLTRLWMHEETE